MPTPFCPTIKRRCIGSDCVRWIPLYTAADGDTGLRMEGWLDFLRGDAADIVKKAKTKCALGVCADNPRAEPFADPMETD